MASPRIERVEIQTTGILNSAVNFTIILDVSTASTATVTIEDPSGSNKISAASMTLSDNQVYTYVWQSDEANEEGTYVATFRMGDGTNTTELEERFEMIRPFDTTD